MLSYHSGFCLFLANAGYILHGYSRGYVTVFPHVFLFQNALYISKRNAYGQPCGMSANLKVKGKISRRWNMAVSASDINGVKTKLVDARTALVTMLGESDKQKQSVITLHLHS